MFSPAHRRHTTKPKRNSDDSDAASTDAVRLATSNSFNHKSDVPVGGGFGGGTGSNRGAGLFSYFARARRRLMAKSHWENDTLLPTTYASNHAATGTPRPSASAITCNSFLMGGHYYPGKDKKRRHMRRRTLWYKIFCSSPWRKLTSFLVVAYVLLWHVLLPVGELVLQVGMNMSAHHGNRYASNWLQYDASLKMPDLALEQKISVELAAARARLQYGSPQRNAQRLNLLGSIVPDWFHRNNNDNTALKQETKEQTKKKIEKQKTATKEKEPPSKEDAPEQKPSESKQKNEALKEVPPQKEEQPKKSRVLQTNGDGLISRTIHTSSAVASTRSKCQAIVDDDSAEYFTTLVTQASLSRLWILNETCMRWKDPIVAVVFVPHGQKMTDQQISSLSCPNLQIIQYMANPEESNLQKYPVNRLRNVGLDAVTTSHVMVMDVDFVPSMDLTDTIRKALQLRHEHHRDGEDHQALVVPAFERLPPSPCESDSDCASFLQSNSSFIPKSFDALQTCILDKDCIVFQSDNNWEGHSTTRSDRWLQRKWYEDEEQKTIFTTIPCFDTARYEPYLILRWCPSSHGDPKIPEAPYYDERFHGYGKNKIELVSHLRKKGYQFAILPEGFIVHNPHPESSIKEAWNDRKNSDLHSSMDNLYAKFLEELDKMYKDAHESSVKLCKREK